MPSTPTSRRTVLRFTLAAAGSAALGTAAGQPAYPSRPVTIVVSFAPGGVTDMIARLYAQKLTQRMGAAFNVDNRPGAGGTIGTEHLAKSAANGYTLGIFLDNNTITPALMAKPSADPVKDFAPITMLAVGTHIIVAHPSFAPNTVKELIDHARAKPGEPYASTGLGTAQHLGMEAIKLKAGIDLTHVPYKGGGQAIIDVVSGQIRLAVLGIAPVLPYLKSGQLKAIALTGETRLPTLSQVPTVTETLPGVTTLQWFGVVAPAGTPAEIVQRLHREFVAVSQDPDVTQRLTAAGLEVRTSAQPQDLARFMAQDMAKWPPLIKAAGLKPE